MARLSDLLPADPPASFLHGDLWTGNILVGDGRLAALIDPACYHGHAEVDLAMLRLFDAPPEEFWEAYGALDEGAEDRLALYQLFPALVHMRLFGATYAPMVDRLLAASENARRIVRPRLRASARFRTGRNDHPRKASWSTFPDCERRLTTAPEPRFSRASAMCGRKAR